jgi:hypothetical protein
MMVWRHCNGVVLSLGCCGIVMGIFWSFHGMVQCCHGGSDLKLGGKCFVGSEFRAEVKLPESS